MSNVLVKLINCLAPVPMIVHPQNSTKQIYIYKCTWFDAAVEHEQTWKKARPARPRVAEIFEDCGRIC